MDLRKHGGTDDLHNTYVRLLRMHAQMYSEVQLRSQGLHPEDFYVISKPLHRLPFEWIGEAFEELLHRLDYSH